MAFFDSSWQDCPETHRSVGAYIISYRGQRMDHVTHVPGPVAQSTTESKYNSECNEVMALENFRILIHEWLHKYLDIVPEEAPLIILDKKSAVCMAKNDKYTKHTRNMT